MHVPSISNQASTRKVLKLSCLSYIPQAISFHATTRKNELTGSLSSLKAATKENEYYVCQTLALPTTHFLQSKVSAGLAVVIVIIHLPSRRLCDSVASLYESSRAIVNSCFIHHNKTFRTVLNRRIEVSATSAPSLEGRESVGQSKDSSWGFRSRSSTPEAFSFFGLDSARSILVALWHSLLSISSGSSSTATWATIYSSLGVKSSNKPVTLFNDASNGL